MQACQSRAPPTTKPQLLHHDMDDTDGWVKAGFVRLFRQKGPCMQAAVGASPRRQDIAQQTLQWWDRQIALLAQRASASGRVADLEAQHAALQQQLASLQDTATDGCAGLPPVPPLLPESATLQCMGAYRLRPASAIVVPGACRAIAVPRASHSPAAVVAECCVHIVCGSCGRRSRHPIERFHRNSQDSES